MKPPVNMAKVLLADDSTELADFLSVLLQLNDFDVQNASTEAAVFEKLDEFKPDIILMDVILSRSNGREVCRAIKNNPLYNNISVILVSASPHLLDDFEACKADDVIEKPFDIKTIIDKINSHITKDQ